MSDLYLGLIALGVIVMATIQVTALVTATRAARRAGELATRVEQDLRPILVNLQKVSEEAARASAQAAAQVDRLDTLVASLAWRVEDTAATIQQTVLQPFRDGLSLLGSLKSVIDGFREPRERREPRDVPPGSEAPPRPRPSPPDTRPAHTAPADDELFIG